MAAFRPGFLSSLTGIVGEDRIRTDRRERTMYSFDIGAMPRLIKPLVPAGIAGAVIRPADEAALIEVVKLAAREGVGLVPRAWATSGYGGVLPPKDAVVVDMSGWQQIITVDADSLTARTQASAVWEDIDRALAKQGLTLRLYPSSYPSSSPAGWLAQGGSGFGSFEYGTFKDNVTAARVVLPTGEVREFTGRDLQMLVADAEGITGIITEVEFRVRPLEPETHRVLSFPDSAAIAGALRDISAAGLPLWSLTALNPESIRLKGQLPHRHGHPWEMAHEHEEPEIPVSHLAVIAYPSSRHDAIDETLRAITAANRGEELPALAAEHEWEQRFAPMRLKRLGPSIVPTEVIVPLAEYGAVLDEIAEKIKQPFILESMLGKGDKVVMLGFIPHDERSFSFNVAFALSLSVIKIAKAHGGAAYSTGLYFRREAQSVLGAEKVAALKSFKATADPRGVLNPGKVIGSGGVLDFVMGAAATFESLARPLANAATPPTGPGDFGREVNGIPGDVAFMAYACARCGYCVPTCEQYNGRGWESQSPRGKYAYIREVIEGRAKWDRAAVDTMLVCTTCEVCNLRCQLQLPIEHNWMTMRGKLIHEEKRGTFPPFEMIASSLRGENDIWAGKRENRANWVPDDVAAKIPAESEYLYFAGCTASYVTTDVAEASIRMLQDSGYDIAYMGTDEACCGIPMKMAGNWDLFEEIYEHNTSEARKRGAKTIVTSCPACALVWKELYADIAAKRGEGYEFETKHYSELVADALAEGKVELKHNPFEGKTVTFHDSCHAGRAQGLYDEPRALLNAIPGVNVVEMEHCREEGLCCGSVLTLIGEAPVAPVLGGMRLNEAVEAGADTVVAMCPCCQVQLRDSNEKNELGLEIDDLARTVASAMGYQIEGKTEHSLYMWSFFDKFIFLMRPDNMAKLMARVFPQMTAAMPMGMGGMVKAMKNVPGGLAMAEKMMPALFPVMAPGILGKVMPDLITAVEQYIGAMPDDMAELMPDLLPSTMDALMPTYLPELIPHLVPLYIGWLRDGAPAVANEVA